MSSSRRPILAALAGTVAVIAVKAKTFGLLAMKFGTTAWTMALAIWIYAQQAGWSFAALFVGLILIHEIGHGVAARFVGVRVGAPMFVPFLGAFIALKDRPPSRWAQFVISGGGPFAGGVASIACLATSYAVDGTAHSLLLGVGYLSVIVNLFNLTPVWILDGSKMLPLVRTRDGIAGIVAVAAIACACAVWKGHLNGTPIVALAVIGYRVALAARGAPRKPLTMLERLELPATPAATVPAEPEAIAATQQLRAALIYFGLVAVYSGVIELADPSVS